MIYILSSDFRLEDNICLNTKKIPHIVPKRKKSGSLAYKIGQAIAVLMSLCASAIIIAATIKLVMWIL